MELTFAQEDNTTICRIKGDMTIDTSSELKRAFMSRMRSNEWHNVVVNLSAVDRIDVSGIATLLEFTKILTELNGSITLAELPENVKGLFEITKSLSIFKFFESEAEAIKYLNDN